MNIVVFGSVAIIYKGERYVKEKLVNPTLLDMRQREDSVLAYLQSTDEDIRKH